MQSKPPHDLKKLKDYFIEKAPFASGQYSQVYKGYYDDKNTGLLCPRAIKVLKEAHNDKPKVLELLNTEISILKNCRNRNVVKLYDYFIHENNHYQVLKYCDGRTSLDSIEVKPLTLQGYLESKPGKVISEQEALSILKQLLNGFQGLHKLEAMHRDFKPENVLFHKGKVKIADLGFAKRSQFANTHLGTNFYMAPEISESDKKKRSIIRMLIKLGENLEKFGEIWRNLYNKKIY